MDFSKAFVTINHNCLLAKIKACGFSRTALNLICLYLKNRQERVVISNKVSSSETILAGAPQEFNK